MKGSVIEIDCVDKKYLSEAILNGISISINKGDVVGLIGANGVGKTTLLKLIMGLIPINAGSICINGDDNLIKGREKIVAVFEVGGYFEEFNARKNLEIICAYAKIGYSQIDAVLDRLNLPKNKKIVKFSKGMLQRLSLAKSLLFDRDIYIFDEPTVGLDIEGQVLFRELIEELKSKNKTVIISSHIISELELHCTSFAMLKQGKLIMFEKVKSIIAEFGSIENAYTECY